MADRYEHIIRGVPADRKPDRADLDAAPETELQNSERLSYYDPAIFTAAVAEATVGASLIKELFDRQIAQKTNSPTPGPNPHVMHICDPAHYNSAIHDATLNGQVHQGFFDKFVAARAIYQVVRTGHPPLAIRQSTEPRISFPPHAQQSQISRTPQPHDIQSHQDSRLRASQTPYTPARYDNEIKVEPFSRPQSSESHKSSRTVHHQIIHADSDRLTTSHAKSPFAYHPPSNGHHGGHRSVLDHDHHRVQGDMHENPTLVSTSLAIQSSALTRTERLQQKNQSSICVECWSRGLKCDSQAFCRECARNRRPCTYVRCPLQDCPSTIICPAYHSWTGDNVTRFVGSSMHLMAMLAVDSPSSLDFDLSRIQDMYCKPDSAAEIYRQIVYELEEAARDGQDIDRVFVKQLVLRRGLDCPALSPKVNLIVKFFAEKK